MWKNMFMLLLMSKAKQVKKCGLFFGHSDKRSSCQVELDEGFMSNFMTLLIRSQSYITLILHLILNLNVKKKLTSSVLTVLRFKIKYNSMNTGNTLIFTKWTIIVSLDFLIYTLIQEVHNI